MTRRSMQNKTTTYNRGLTQIGLVGNSKVFPTFVTAMRKVRGKFQTPICAKPQRYKLLYEETTNNIVFWLIDNNC